VNTVAYNASKAAVIQLARSLAAEWGRLSGPPIRVNSVIPGYIYTWLTVDALARPEVKMQWIDSNMLR
jgi:NAD(P)-dependent dehydrogenase (short-subunit alcohol dehydrogenase family)